MPKIQMAGGQGGGSLIESLLGLMLSEKAGQLAGVAPATVHPEAEALKAQLRDAMKKG